MRLGSAITASAATGLSLAMVFYFAGIGQNVVKKAANWVIAQSSDVVQ
jgi:hypothetical protein